MPLDNKNILILTENLKGVAIMNVEEMAISKHKDEKDEIYEKLYNKQRQVVY